MTGMENLNDKYLAKVAAGKQGPKRAALAQAEVAARAAVSDVKHRCSCGVGTVRWATLARHIQAAGTFHEAAAS